MLKRLAFPVYAAVRPPVLDVLYGLCAYVGPTTRLRCTARRHIAFHYLKGQARSIIFERDGITWITPTGEVVPYWLFRAGSYEGGTLAALIRWIRQNQPQRMGSNMTVLNVGANIGDTCVQLCRLAEIHCIACEPVPATFNYLTQNVAANGLQEFITCRQVAISDSDGTIEMVTTVDSAWSEIRSQRGAQGFGVPDSSRPVVHAPARSLTTLLKEEQLAPSEIAFVWSDTQGFERHVIDGGACLWESGVPLWVEVWPKALEAHGGLREFLASAGRHFKKMLTEKQLLAGCSLHSASGVSSLEKLTKDLGTYGRMTNVMLMG